MDKKRFLDYSSLFTLVYLFGGKQKDRKAMVINERVYHVGRNDQTNLAKDAIQFPNEFMFHYLHIEDELLTSQEIYP